MLKIDLKFNLEEPLSWELKRFQIALKKIVMGSQKVSKCIEQKFIKTKTKDIFMSYVCLFLLLKQVLLEGFGWNIYHLA